MDIFPDGQLPHKSKPSLPKPSEPIYKQNGFRVKYLLILLLNLSVFAGADLLENLSPPLARFVSENKAAYGSLTNALHDSFSKSQWQFYYFYSTNPASPRAYHFYPDENSVAIAVRENQIALDQYLSLVFEVFNAGHREEFEGLLDRAYAKTISKEDFVREMTKVEFKSILKMRDTLRALSIKKKYTANSYDYERFIHCPNDFDSYLKYREKIRTPERDAMKERAEIFDKITAAAKVPDR